MRQKQEREYPLLRAMWCNLNHSEPQRINKMRQGSVVRWLVMRQLCRTHESTPETLAFMEVMESESMCRLLWSRNSYHLRDSWPLRKDSNGDWDHVEGDAGALAAEELVHLRDDNEDLGELVEQYFGEFTWDYGDGEVKQKVFFASTNGLVRVHYTPTSSHKHTYASLRRFKMHILNLLKKPGTTKEVLEKEVEYTLVAVVHTPKAGELGVRVYELNGHPLQLGPGVEHLSHGWRIGDKDEGHYMLYYKQAVEVDQTGDEFPEALPRAKDRDAMLASLPTLGTSPGLFMGSLPDRPAAPDDIDRSPTANTTQRTATAGREETVQPAAQSAEIRPTVASGAERVSEAVNTARAPPNAPTAPRAMREGVAPHGRSRHRSRKHKRRD